MRHRTSCNSLSKDNILTNGLIESKRIEYKVKRRAISLHFASVSSLDRIFDFLISRSIERRWKASRGGGFNFERFRYRDSGSLITVAVYQMLPPSSSVLLRRRYIFLQRGVYIYFERPHHRWPSLEVWLNHDPAPEGLS